ncbi:CPBP family intramembrane metalloprotease, partial [Escherichia coli]|nr:CPBP family intramembrane metalloprotease [Escherichia coli]
LGILLTGAVGTVLAALYFAAMGLALPIAVHLVINFNALIVRPALQRRFGRSAD